MLNKQASYYSQDGFTIFGRNDMWQRGAAVNSDLEPWQSSPNTAVLQALEFYFLIPEHHSYVPQARPPAIIKNASAACWLSRAPINSALC